MIKTPFLTFVYLSKCNMGLPCIFRNSKKRFLWTVLLFMLIYWIIKSRFHMNVAWKAQPSSTFRFWISSLWSMKSGDIFQTFSDQRRKIFFFQKHDSDIFWENIARIVNVILCHSFTSCATFLKVLIIQICQHHHM